MITVILLLIIILIVTSIPFIRFRMKLGFRLGYWLLGIYCLFLVVSIGIYFMIPEENFLEDDSWLEYKPVEILHHVGYKQVPIDEFAEYRAKSWEFDATGLNKITLASYNDIYLYEYPVIISRTNDTGKITVDLYKNVVDLDWGEKESYQGSVFMESDFLFITPPGARYTGLGQFEKEFPFTQFFSDESNEWILNSYDVMVGENVFYITIPEDIEVTIESDIFVKWLD